MKVARYANLLILTGAVFSGAAQAETIKIATVSPTAQAFGDAVYTGAKLAVMERQTEFKKLGINLQLLSFDDEASAAKGKKIARKILNDTDIYGVVGAADSSVSQELGRAFADRRLAVISPSSTNDQLTRNGWTHFTRMVAPDRAQTWAAANYMSSLEAKRIVVVSDNTVYGNGLCKALMSTLKNNKDQPIKVINYQGASNKKQYAKVVQQLNKSQPDLIYFGGSSRVGAELVTALRTAGLNTLFMGGDGLDTPDFVKHAGKNAINVKLTTVFGPPKSFKKARLFKMMYKKTYKKMPSSISIFSYDAAHVLMDAIKREYIAKNGNITHALVSQAVRTIKKPGCLRSRCHNISGAIQFTKNGERSLAKVMVMQYNNRLQLKPKYHKLIKAKDLYETDLEAKR